MDPNRRILHERKAYHVRLNETHQQIVQHSETESSLFKAVEKWLERFPFFKSDDFDFLNAYKMSVQEMFSMDKETLLRDTQDVVVAKEQSVKEDATSVREDQSAPK
jgi:tryptophan 2,3-dioxygenase